MSSNAYSLKNIERSRPIGLICQLLPPEFLQIDTNLLSVLSQSNRIYHRCTYHRFLDSTYKHIC